MTTTQYICPACHCQVTLHMRHCECGDNSFAEKLRDHFYAAEDDASPHPHPRPLGVDPGAAAEPEPLHIVFDGPPGPEGPRLVECETADGLSVKAGEWREIGWYWHLVVPGRVYAPSPALAELREAMDKLQRVRDWLKHAANSDGGIVAEIDALLEARDDR